MNQGEAILRFNKASFAHRQNKPILDEVDFSVRRGTKVFLISKTKEMRGGALWVSKDAIRFTDQGRRKGLIG